MSPEAVAITIAGSVGLSGNDLAVGLLEQSKDCVKLLSIDGHLDFMNCNGLLAMEIDDTADVIGRLWWDLWPEPSRPFVEARFRLAAQGGEAEFAADGGNVLHGGVEGLGKHEADANFVDQLRDLLWAEVDLGSQRLQHVGLSGEFKGVRISSVGMQDDRIPRCVLTDTLGSLIDKTNFAQRLTPAMKPDVQAMGS